MSDNFQCDAIVIYNQQQQVHWPDRAANVNVSGPTKIMYNVGIIDLCQFRVQCVVNQKLLLTAVAVISLARQRKRMP